MPPPPKKNKKNKNTMSVYCKLNFPNTAFRYSYDENWSNDVACPTPHQKETNMILYTPWASVKLGPLHVRLICWHYPPHMLYRERCSDYLVVLIMHHALVWLISHGKDVWRVVSLGCMQVLPRVLAVTKILSIHIFQCHKNTVFLCGFVSFFTSVYLTA